MTEIRKSGTDYIGYEYKEKSVPASFSSLYLDSYPCFGWEEDPNGSNHIENTKTTGRVSLRFRRDRKICNKTELTRLQRSFDGCMAEIEALENAKTSLATMWTLIVGLVGTAFIAGSTFAVTAEPPMWTLMILLAIPGFIGWIATYFVYQWLVRRQTAKVAPLIEQKYNELYEICEKGSRLLL